MRLIVWSWLARKGSYRDTIEYPASGSIYRALSSEAYTKEGLSPTLVLADELHAWPNRELALHRSNT